MVRKTLGGYPTINTYVEAKLKRFFSMEPGFASLFEMMFSEPGNIMYERSHGYQILKKTYGEVRLEIEARIPVLSGLLSGIPKGSMIGLYLGNSLDWIELFWAILACGYEPLLMNLRLPLPVLHEVLRDSEVPAVISGGQEFPVKTIPAGEISADSGNEAAKEEKAFSPDAGTRGSGNPGSTLSGFGKAIHVMSSGTSDRVKVCAYTAEELAYEIRDSFDIIRECTLMKRHYKSQLKHLTFLPFYHIFGLTAVYIWFSFFSRTFVELPDLTPRTILNTIRKHGVTHIFAVPMFWDRVYEEALSEIRSRGKKTEEKFKKGLEIEAKIGDVPLFGKLFRTIAFREIRQGMFGNSIRFMISGGSEIRPEVLRFFNAIGYHLANGYGMTEIGITSVELSRKHKILNSTSIGQPFTSVEYRISEEGELMVRGRTLSRLIREGLTIRERDSESWFNTHDLAEYRDGCYYILGRKDDVVIGPSGENLNPNLIEPKLRIPGAIGTALISREKDGTKIPVLLVGVRRHTDASGLRALRQQAGEALRELGLGSAVSEILFTKEPLIGEEEFKLNRGRLSKRLSEGSLKLFSGEAGEQGQRDSLTSAVIRILAEVLRRNPEEIPENADFYTELGGTSLDYFSFAERISGEFGKELSFSDSESLTTAKSVAAYLKKEEGT